MKAATNVKSEIWKKFAMVFETNESAEEVPVNYYCACIKCNKVYQFKDSTGKNFGTKNQQEHIKHCTGGLSNSQLKIQQCMKRQIQLSPSELMTFKQKQVSYCVSGYHSFRSVENSGLINLMQNCVELGAKYGKFDVRDVAVGRRTVSRDVTATAASVVTKLTERLKEPIADGSMSLCIDMYTDDFRKQAYLDVHCSWIDRDFTSHHAALAVRHFGTASHTAQHIYTAVSNILGEYGIPVDEVPFTTDHGSNVVAALKSGIRVDCMCHRLHTVLESAWKDTRQQVPDAAAYETAVSELCRFAKQSVGIQEQLPESLKHGGDTRPWVSMFRRSKAVEASYDALVTVLTTKNRLELIAGVNRTFNKEIRDLTEAIAEVFQSLEKIDEPTINLVGPSYFLLMKKFAPVTRDSVPMQAFRKNLRKYMDEKFWNSIVALHWMASFLDPSFENFDFVPEV